MGFYACGDSSKGTSGSGFVQIPEANIESEEPEVQDDSVIYMYSTAPSYANLGGRNAADWICGMSLPSNLSTLSLSVRAFISIDSNDEILDMPANYGVPVNRKIQGANEEDIIATSWSDLLDGTIAMSLSAAHILSPAQTFWSGSNPNGSLSVANCNGWTSTAAGVYAAVGDAMSTGNWTYTTSNSCNGTRPVLCIAY